MKVSKIALTAIVTTFLLSIGGVAAYAETPTDTTSQEVTSSPESTPTPASSQTLPNDIPGEMSEQKNQAASQATPATESSVAPSQPTEKKGAGTSTPTMTDGAKKSEEGTSGNPTKSTPTERKNPNTDTSTSPTKTNVSTTETTATGPTQAGPDTKGHTPVTLCHNKTNTITVDDDAVAAHVAHGDTLGECPVAHPIDPAPVDTVDIYWAMPYPGNPNNVTWPQAFASPNNLQCGIWYQVDTYKPEEAMRFTEDGVLDQGEDYQNASQVGAISWRFVYGGDCTPITPENPGDKTEILDSHDTTDCTAGTVTHIETTQLTTYTLDERTHSWVANIDLPVTTEQTRAATEEECPVNTQPTTVGPTSPSAPVVALQQTTPTSTLGTPSMAASAAPSPHTERLAKTGSDDGMTIAFIFLLALVLLILGTAGIISSRNEHTK